MWASHVALCIPPDSCKHQVSGECLRWRCMFVGLSTVRGQLLHNSRYPSICSACPCVRLVIKAALSQHIYDWWWNRIYIYIFSFNVACLPAAANKHSSRKVCRCGAGSSQKRYIRHTADLCCFICYYKYKIIRDNAANVCMLMHYLIEFEATVQIQLLFSWAVTRITAGKNIYTCN